MSDQLFLGKIFTWVDTQRGKSFFRPQDNKKPGRYLNARASLWACQRSNIQFFMPVRRYITRGTIKRVAASQCKTIIAPARNTTPSRTWTQEMTRFLKSGYRHGLIISQDNHNKTSKTKVGLLGALSRNRANRPPARVIGNPVKKPGLLACILKRAKRRAPMTGKESMATMPQGPS